MNKLTEEDQILKEIFSRTKRLSAPGSLKSGILRDISRLPDPVRLKTNRPGFIVLISVGVVLLTCLIWTLTSINGAEWQLPKLNEINIPSDFDKWIAQTSQFFDKLLAINLSSNEVWVYYLGGGLILFWFYFIVNLVLDKLTHSKRNYSV